MMKKKVSIIVPIYNVESYLVRCLENLINQTYSNLEIILVDDGSPDNCPKICDEYAKKDKRIKVIHKKNGGLSDARNAGLDIASGDYIYFIDSDDFCEINIIEKMVAHMEKNFVICNHFVDNGNSIFEKSNLQEGIIKKDAIYDLINKKEYFCGYVWNKMYSKKIIDSLNIRFEKDLLMLEDLVFNCKYLMSDEVTECYYINDCLYTYFIRSGSILNSVNFNDEKTIKNKLSVYKCLDILYDLYEKKSPNNLNSIKLRYIKTTYQYVAFIKNSKASLELIKDKLYLSKKYYKEIKSTLSFRDRIKLIFNMTFPCVYLYLGNKKRVE